MPRPIIEGQYDDRRPLTWPAILLASPVGLLIALIVVSEIRMTAPAVIDAEAAGIVSTTPIARPEPVTVPAALPPPATARPDLESARGGRTVSAAELRALIADPAVRDFKGLSENAWDFNRPAGIPGFGPYLRADDRHAADEFELTPE
jgi:hypothetical protein